jgi:cold shock CspA family protein
VKGRLVYWNHDRGFGFIARDRIKDNNVFVLAVAFINGEIPKIGDFVEFDVQADRASGRERAANAVIVE